MIRWLHLNDLLRRSADEHRSTLELAERAAKFGIVVGLDDDRPANVVTLISGDRQLSVRLEDERAEVSIWERACAATAGVR